MNRNSKYTDDEKLKIWSKKGKENYNYKHGHTLIEIFCSDCNKKLKTVYKENKIFYCKSCNAKRRIKDKNPFYGKTHTEEFKKKMSESKKGVPNTRDSKKVKIDGIVYDSYTHASTIIQCTVSTICNRIKSDKFPNYKKID